MVLIEARAGGTFAAGQDVLAMGVRLFTADHSTRLESNDGNRILLDHGDRPEAEPRHGESEPGPAVRVGTRAEVEGAEAGQGDVSPR